METHATAERFAGEEGRKSAQSGGTPPGTDEECAKESVCEQIRALKIDPPDKSDMYSKAQIG